MNKVLSLLIKRIFDVIISTLGLIALVPLFLIVIVLIKLNSSGPAFFKQQRMGKDARLFWIYKFRTMRNEALSGIQVTSKGDSRITSIGKFLRKTKIDELPQLWNVLFGDMSLVGPRPEVPKYFAYYSPEDKDKVLSVRPGITDLAAIIFRDEESILGRSEDPEQAYILEVLPQKIELYKKYIQNRSFLLDLKIIAQTFFAIGNL